MQYRQIGTSGLNASVLSLGSYQTYSRMEYRDIVNLVRRGSVR